MAIHYYSFITNFTNRLEKFDSFILNHIENKFKRTLLGEYFYQKKFYVIKLPTHLKNIKAIHWFLFFFPKLWKCIPAIHRIFLHHSNKNNDIELYNIVKWNYCEGCVVHWQKKTVWVWLSMWVLVGKSQSVSESSQIFKMSQLDSSCLSVRQQDWVTVTDKCESCL